MRADAFHLFCIFAFADVMMASTDNMNNVSAASLELGNILHSFAADNSIEPHLKCTCKQYRVSKITQRESHTIENECSLFYTFMYSKYLSLA